MSTSIEATFDVTTSTSTSRSSRRDRQADEGEGHEVVPGDISADSLTEVVDVLQRRRDRVLRGLERIIGSVGKREGTLVVQHVGRFEGGAATAELTVVGGACSGDLAGAQRLRELRRRPSRQGQPPALVRLTSRGSVPTAAEPAVDQGRRVRCGHRTCRYPPRVWDADGLRGGVTWRIR